MATSYRSHISIGYIDRVSHSQQEGDGNVNQPDATAPRLHGSGAPERAADDPVSLSGL
jgi:hypothetical protein